jgi:hypothetical protein
MEPSAQAIGIGLPLRSPVVAHLNRQLREGYRRRASISAVPEMTA